MAKQVNRNFKMYFSEQNGSILMYNISGSLVCIEKAKAKYFKNIQILSSYFFIDPRIFFSSPTFTGSAHYGQGHGPVLLDDLGCIGSENQLWECNNRGWYKVDCSHAEDVGVNCFS